MKFQIHMFMSLILMVMALLLSSCAHNIYISHNSFADTKAIPLGFPHFTSFTVEPLNHKDPMMSQEITTKIEHLLEKNGYLVEEEMHAHYYVLFDYHMEQFDQTVTVEKYVPGQTITSYGSVLSNGKAKLYQGQTQTAGSFVSVPEVHRFFNKALTIQVYDAKEYRNDAHAKPVWKETASCCDENDDLRDSLDYLLITAFEFFGRNTQKNIETIISSDDKDVSELRQELFN